MKKKFLLSTLLCAALFLGTNLAQAEHHSQPHNKMHRAQSMHHQMHRPAPMPYMHSPSHHHHRNHVRQYYYYSSPYYSGYYNPIGFITPRYHYPMHHSLFGATFHISI